MPEDARRGPDWASARRRRAGPSRIVAVVLLHVVVLVALRLAFDRVELRVRGDRAMTLVEVALAPPAPPVPAARAPAPPTVPARPRMSRPAPAPRMPESPASPQAITLPPAAVAEAPASAASAPPLVLDPLQTRLAIREVARHPSTSGLARAADAGPGANERLAQGLAAAQKGDCSKGEFFGGGAGLISLPFLVAAEAMGHCSSK